MTLQIAAAVLDGMLDAFETAIGGSPAPVLEIRSGAKPASPDDPDSGTLLASATLPADWMLAAANAVKTKSGTWQDAAANASGDAGHFRIKSGSDCVVQGAITLAGGGGDMIVPTLAVVSGEPFVIAEFTIALTGNL